MSDRFNFLTPTESLKVQSASCLVAKAFGMCIYQVGSSLVRPDYRDVDLRAILDDEEFDRLIQGNGARLRLLNSAITDWMQAMTGLPIDFQFQRQTEANEKYGGKTRNFMAVPIDAVPMEMIPQQPNPPTGDGGE
jgi:hypothetical protein